MLTRTDDRTDLYIGGEWVDAEGGATEVISPLTEETFGFAPNSSERDIERAVAAARAAFDAGEWRRTPPAERAAVLDSVADYIEERAGDLAEMITAEMGGPIWFSRAAQVPGPIFQLRYYADLIRNFDFDELRDDGANRSLVTREPVGVVAAATPWNAPLHTPILKIAPAIAAGCSVVFKPPAQAAFSAYAIAEAFEAAGLPAGVFNYVPGEREIGQYLVEHEDIDMVTFTGSSSAGRRIMQTCGDRIARVCLELGGKSAAVLLEDADLDLSMPRLVPLCFMVSGQACIANSRVLAPRHRYDEVSEALATAVAEAQVGDPFDEGTVVGPLVSERQRDRVEGLIRSGLDQGAKVLTGGGRPAEHPRGYFVEPTVLGEVHNEMRIAREEIFGPVFTVIPYEDEADAIRIANDSPFGLAGSVWSADSDHALAVARELRTGMVSINGYNQSAESPHGGYKQSGIGRESGPDGFWPFLETKSIAVGADG